ncbi:MarR family winged helix-turn-helix transcriptional regulator [Streptococcus pluranimalium]
MTDIRKETKQLMRLFDQQGNLYENYARQHGLQGKSLNILLWIYYNPQGVTQNWICKKTYSTKQVVHATIKNWHAKGYLYFKENDKDRRHKLLFLTEIGRAFASAILDPLEKMEMMAMSTLTAEERAVLLNVFGKYSNAVTALLTEKKEELDD